jgi:hypothetical protein
MSQIRSVAATDKLTNTLDTVLLGQNISSATNLIGKEIDGISVDGQTVTGTVERVAVVNGQPQLHLELKPQGAASTEEGEIESGTYEYRVVWEQGGVQYGLDPLMTEDGRNGAIQIGGREGIDQAVQLTNLPAVSATRRVYRRAVGDANFQLVGEIDSQTSATYVDKTSKANASTVLTGSYQAVTSRREFEVNLKNVSQIRPKVVTTPVEDPGTDESETDQPTDTVETETDETSENNG